MQTVRGVQANTALQADERASDGEKMREKEEIYKDAIRKWGMEAQIIIAMEECAELIVSLSKVLRYGFSDTHEAVIEELADVEIMLEQMQIIFDYRLRTDGAEPKDWPSALKNTKEHKLWRLENTLLRSKE